MYAHIVTRRLELQHEFKNFHFYFKLVFIKVVIYKTYKINVAAHK